MATYRYILALIWIIGALGLFCVIFLSSINGPLSTDPAAGWQWLLPNIMPTLSLIASSYFVPDLKLVKVGGSRSLAQFFQFAVALSVFYLFAILATIGAWAFRESGSLIDWLLLSNFWLGPLQGLTAAVIGIFFVQKVEAAQN